MGSKWLSALIVGRNGRRASIGDFDSSSTQKFTKKYVGRKHFEKS